VIVVVCLLVKIIIHWNPWSQGRPTPPGAMKHAAPSPQFSQEKLHISVSRQIAIKPQEGHQL